jgi:hypothetical protein
MVSKEWWCGFDGVQDRYQSVKEERKEAEGGSGTSF